MGLYIFCEPMTFGKVSNLILPPPPFFFSKDETMIMKLQFLDYDDSMFLLITKYFLLRFLQFFLSDDFIFYFFYVLINFLQIVTCIKWRWQKFVTLFVPENLERFNYLSLSNWDSIFSPNWGQLNFRANNMGMGLIKH